MISNQLPAVNADQKPSFNKSQTAFFRKLYIAYLIDQEELSIPTLELQTGMPRRTLQDCIKGFADLKIICEFVSRDGTRNNDGYYRISDWGPINPEWIGQQKNMIEQALGLAL